MRFDDQDCSGSNLFTAVQATTKESHIVTISRLLLGGGQLEVAERLSEVSEEIKVIELYVHVHVYALSVKCSTLVFTVPVIDYRKQGLKIYRHQKVCLAGIV